MYLEYELIDATLVFDVQRHIQTETDDANMTETPMRSMETEDAVSPQTSNNITRFVLPPYEYAHNYLRCKVIN